ncbi:oxaloacetate decarboxylase alpha subunit [Halanaerobium saccharolyticum]|uniref:Oxaloacetate decarboxylase alpha subunit n=1 Tax=Halanaerobium saccharolyticum TaxID=43595 RepID=A0A4R6RXW6_9FIRM|nr:pyruvate carboxylase subunit B [Halanaerobium saccharolyticum]TDP91205.1 oxaloacetate decarboxylase alpha subunit [Halanaerobium saccharolyticum]
MSVKFTETVLRDGQQSLIATRLKIEDIIPVLTDLDQVGYHALEVWGGATFDSCMRFLNEDPWERLRRIRKGVKKTKLQMLLRGQNILGYKHYPDDVLERFIKKSVENGIDIIRIFDALNDIRNMEKAVEFTKKYGAEAQGSIVYTTSPIHSSESFVKKAKELSAKGIDSLCIKDMAGLLTPFKAYDLVKKLKSEIEIPVEIHSHNTAGFAFMTYLKAIEAGVDIIDMAISAFSSGTAQPTTETLAAVLNDSQFDTDLNLDSLEKIGDYFREVRENYRDYLGSYEVDPRIIRNQLPGGMLSNLRNQLQEQNQLDRYQEILEEIPKVRKDLGYPPLVTPTSQIVGTQAVFNVVTGKKYSFVSKEFKNYLRGMYGSPPGEINPELIENIISKDQVITNRPADNLEPVYEKAAAEIKDLSQKEEDILSYILFPEVAEKFLQDQHS